MRTSGKGASGQRAGGYSGGLEQTRQSGVGEARRLERNSCEIVGVRPVVPKRNAEGEM